MLRLFSSSSFFFLASLFCLTTFTMLDACCYLIIDQLSCIDSLAISVLPLLSVFSQSKEDCCNLIATLVVIIIIIIGIVIVIATVLLSSQRKEEETVANQLPAPIPSYSNFHCDCCGVKVKI